MVNSIPAKHQYVSVVSTPHGAASMAVDLQLCLVARNNKVHKNINSHQRTGANH